MRSGGRRSIVLGVLVVATAAALGVLGYRSLAVSAPSAASPLVTEPRPASTPLAATPAPEGLQPVSSGTAGEADGVLPAGVTAFDDNYAAVSKLDPALLHALRRATTDAARTGVHLYVNSGWRSPTYQEQLRREAIAKYGSEQAAARWVETPADSAHVSGNAVDIGRADADQWLSRHGAAYGLCQIYRNEPWHYELRPDAVAHGCPAMYADAAHDPRTNS